LLAAFSDQAAATDYVPDVKPIVELLPRITAKGGSAIFDTLLKVAGKTRSVQASSPEKLDVFVVITDGEDSASKNGLEAAVEAAQRARAVVFVITMLGGNYDRYEKRARRAMERIALTSGGVAYFPDSMKELDVAVRQLAQEVEAIRWLVYTPATALSGKGSGLELKPAVKDKKVVVRVQDKVFSAESVQ
jgi:Ca-activated chloride channel family protein